MHQKQIDNLTSLLAEQSVIGGMLLNGETDNATYALEILTHDDFYFPETRQAWKFISLIDSKNQPIDIVTVAEAAEKAGSDLCFSSLGEMAKITPSQANLRRYADIVKSNSKLRAAYLACVTAADAITDNGDPEQRLAKALDAVANIGADTAKEDEPKDSKDVLNEVIDEMQEALKNGSALSGLSSGFENIDTMTGGFQEGDLIIIAARPSMGKELQNSALVYMADGTSKPICEIIEGDKLASIDGKPSSVVGVYPQGVKDIYQVTFSDGRSVIAGLEHQWEIRYKGWKRSKILTTKDVIEILKKPMFKNRLCIPFCNGEFGEDAGLTIDPYLLGALIGDGNLSQQAVRFSNPDDFVIDLMKPMVGNLEIKHQSGCDYSIVSKRGQGNWLITELKKFGLFGKKSFEKHIPCNYLSASRKSRVRLMNGLMDTDGTVEKHGTMTYTTTSKRLSNDFLNLARSLGYWAKESSRITNYTYNGEKRQGKRSYTITIQGDGMAELVTLPRKRDRLSGRSSGRKMNLTFTSIEKIGQDECTCIMVSHERSLFLTDDYIATHNTTLAMNIAENVAYVNENKGNVLVFSLEMPRKALVKKTICRFGSLFMKKINTGQALHNDYDAAQVGKAIGIIANSTGQFIIDDKGGQHISQLRARAKRAAMKYGKISLIVVDYLQLVQAEGASKNEEVSKVSAGLKNMAKEMRCPVIALSQLNRALTGRPEMKNLRDSGAIEQDADVIIFLHDEDYEEDRGDHSLTEAIFGKQRNGPTGTTYLQPELAFSRFADTKRLPVAKPEQDQKQIKRRNFE